MSAHSHLQLFSCKHVGSDLATGSNQTAQQHLAALKEQQSKLCDIMTRLSKSVFELRELRRDSSDNLICEQLLAAKNNIADKIIEVDSTIQKIAEVYLIGSPQT
jgi:uncharacterized protein (DUF342 family)